MSLCVHHKALGQPCVDCLREELKGERRKLKAWQEIAGKRSAERDEARQVARKLLRIFHLDDCKGLDAILKANPWLKEACQNEGEDRETG